MQRHLLNKLALSSEAHSFHRASFGRTIVEVVDDEVITNLVRDAIGGVGQPISRSTKIFLDSDPSTFAIRNFLEKNPNLVDWFSSNFPYVAKDKIQAHILCCGIVFHLDGYAYADFVKNEGIRSDGQPASFGVILTLDKLPKEIRDLIVVVNKGDGYYGERNSNDIHSTQTHEVLHILFNRFFSRAPFVSSSMLASELSCISAEDSISIGRLANRAHDGMVEIARSEMISYLAQGNKRPDFRQICGNFWKAHFEVVHDYLNSNSVCSKQKFNIISVFWDAFHSYRSNIDKLSDWIEMNYTDKKEEIDLSFLVKMLRYDPFLEHLAKGNNLKAIPRFSDMTFDKAA